MSVSYFVRYDIRAQDLARFLSYYEEHHVPVLAGWPGLRRVVLHKPIGWQDPSPVNRGASVLLAQLEFESIDALNHALASPERAEARRDFQRFPPFEGTVTHQAMQTVEAWRSRP
ncbi:MAG TPA: EthD family reductase [Burkholderiales bacterium]|jgi:uncharacterized protein (TIGR02118 family)|nr:EthD family reductase [Burkholderiales bacterium]